MHAIGAALAALLAIFGLLAADQGEWLKAIVFLTAFALAIYELLKHGEQ